MRPPSISSLTAHDVGLLRSIIPLYIMLIIVFLFIFSTFITIYYVYDLCTDVNICLFILYYLNAEIKPNQIKSNQENTLDFFYIGGVVRPQSFVG